MFTKHKWFPFTFAFLDYSHELAITHLRDFEVRQREQWQTDMRIRMQKELKEKETVLRTELQKVSIFASIGLHAAYNQLQPQDLCTHI